MGAFQVEVQAQDQCPPQLPAGAWYVHVCAADNAGNWSSASAIGPFVILPGAIFVDGFESGDTSAWSAAVP